MTLILGRAESIWARGVVGLGGLLFVAFSLACMNLSFGGKTEVAAPASDGSEGLQRGKAFVPPGGEICVYYPVPYLSPPNLEFEDSEGKRRIQIVEQRPDYVRLKNTSPFGVDLPWKARGVQSTTAKAPVAAPAVQTPERATVEFRGP
jgi:hypothetical protein